MGNAATGFFVVFAMIAGVVGVASCISGISHLRYWDIDSLPAAASAATISWSLTALAMGYNNTTISQLPFHFYSKNLAFFLLTMSQNCSFFLLDLHAKRLNFISGMPVW